MLWTSLVLIALVSARMRGVLARRSFFSVFWQRVEPVAKSTFTGCWHAALFHFLFEDKDLAYRKKCYFYESRRVLPYVACLVLLNELMTFHFDRSDIAWGLPRAHLACAEMYRVRTFPLYVFTLNYTICYISSFSQLKITKKKRVKLHVRAFSSLTREINTPLQKSRVLACTSGPVMLVLSVTRCPVSFEYCFVLLDFSWTLNGKNFKF